MSGYRIKTVASLTGVSSELLRAWERRYGVVTPRRSRGGYREYSEQDVEKLRLLKALTARGYTIGELASLAVPDLGDLLHRERERKDTVAAPGPRQSVIVDHLVAQACERDPRGFRRALRRTLALLPAAEALDDVLSPLLVELTERRRTERHQHAYWVAVEEVRGHVGSLCAGVGGDAPVVAVCPLVHIPPGSLVLHAQLGCLQAGTQPVSIPPIPDPWLLAEEMGAAASILCVEGRGRTRAVRDMLESWTPPETLVVFGSSTDLDERVARRRGVSYVGVTDDLPSTLREVMDGRG